VGEDQGGAAVHVEDQGVVLVPEAPRARDIDEVGGVLADNLVQEYDGLEAPPLYLP